MSFNPSKWRHVFIIVFVCMLGWNSEHLVKYVNFKFNCQLGIKNYSCASSYALRHHPDASGILFHMLDTVVNKLLITQIKSVCVGGWD